MQEIQWHEQEVKQLPSAATLLASSEHCRVQAFAVGEYAFGLQFHSEVTDVTVEDWGQIPAYYADLARMLGFTGSDMLKLAVSQQLPIMNHDAKTVFDNFLRIVKRRYS